MQRSVIVVKLGTSSITSDDGLIDEVILSNVVRQLSVLHKDHNIILVSSGAVGTGKKHLQNFKGNIKDRKAAAAVGNPILMSIYTRLFSEHNISIGQTLLERHHFSERKRFLSLRDTIETLWENGIIPIANENDVVSDLELRFSDNDHLATLLAAGFGASRLLIGTAVEGVLDHEDNIIETAESATQLISEFVRDETSALGLGGMAAKLSYANLATMLGIDVTIFGLSKKNAIILASQQKTGTFFPSQPCTPSLRSKWIASGSISSGSVSVDSGAKKAIVKRNSLLLVGVTTISSSFTKGEVIDIQHEGKTFAVGIAHNTSRALKDTLDKNNTIVCHADDIVII